MLFSSVVTNRVLGWLQQKGAVSDELVLELKESAQDQRVSELRVLLEQRPKLSTIVAQVISKLTKTPLQKCDLQNVQEVRFDSGIAFVTLAGGESFRAVLDPMVFPEDERFSLVVIDYQTYVQLEGIQKNGSTNATNPNPSDVSSESAYPNDVSHHNDEENEGIVGLGLKTEWELIDGDANEQLERILSECIEMGASDVHIDLDELDNRLVSRIRFRIDGECRDMVIDPRKTIYEGIVSRLKTLSYCRLDESRVPQDGRVPYVHKGKNYEFRISFNPVTKKNEQLEKVVLRQMADVSKCNLDMLGILPYNLKLFREAIALPYGFNIVTGPTGSGKTTTLYSVLQEIDRTAKNVCSIEEPIEAEVSRVNQTQVRHDIGLDFARVLRALLRQDPDVIMVGEMRDLETAETALDAALTGHVVWSTLHTNSAVASISRLIQMGIKDYMAANALAYIVAQRLLQRVCTDCKIIHPEAETLLKQKIIPAFAGASEAVKAELETALKNTQIYKAKRDNNDCQKCEGRGYKGRVGVMEVLKMNDAMRDIVIREEGNEQKLQQEAVRSGMMTMEQYGYLKVLEGETTVEAVLAVIVSN